MLTWTCRILVLCDIHFYLATQWTETILTPIFWAFFHVDGRPCLKTTWVTCLLSVLDTCHLKCIHLFYNLILFINTTAKIKKCHLCTHVLQLLNERIRVILHSARRPHINICYHILKGRKRTVDKHSLQKVWFITTLNVWHHWHNICK